MKHIEKIIIDNARRFGKNVEIDFGKGATIILAPNGTGKTTIFEAIEFAMTGEIKRIENFPEAIIRDEFIKMSARLEFSEGKYCQVDYTKGENRILTGFHDELFSLENNTSLPYLFRLTHLLDQRGGDWFVEKEEREAGDVLGQLPIGKDLAKIIKKKTSCIREIGTKIRTAENNLNIAKELLSEFETLKVKRNEFTYEISLIPLEEINSKLVLISKLTNLGEINENYTYSQINSYFEKLRVSIQQENTTKKDLIKRLNILKERIPLYHSNTELLVNSREIVSKYETRILELISLIETNKKDTKDGVDTLDKIKYEKKNFTSIKFMFEEVGQKTELLNARSIELVKYKNELTNLSDSYIVTLDYLKKIVRLRDQYKLINETLELNRTLLLKTDLKLNFQKQWFEMSNINQEIIEKIIPAIEKRMSDCIRRKKLHDKEVVESNDKHMAKKNALESLNKASGAIQEALSNIRENITEKQQECPVCQAIYEPGDLIRRIEESLNTINPTIPIAIKEEKDALINLELDKEIQVKINQELQSIHFEITAEKNKLDANNREIYEYYLPLFPECKTPDEASIQINQQIIQINLKIKEIEFNKSILEPEDSIGEIDNLYLKKQEDERLISELTVKLDKIQNEITVGSAEINSINDILIGKDYKIVNENLSRLIEAEIKNKEYLQNLTEIVFKNEEELKACQCNISNETEIASKIRGNQVEIATEWSQAGLEGQPSEEKLKINHETVLNIINELEKANSDLNMIEQDIVNWRCAEKYHEVDDLIKKQIGSSSEEAYLESLKTSVNKSDTDLFYINKKSKAITLLLDNLLLENDQIHKLLNTINEPWKGLLKRIVINPLISSAPLLCNTISRNQPKATTSAIINKEHIGVAKIASEAQLADLQLTFMLAMANKFEWTPWKALLLDDPTQHHDLVHASSVFDVLRDYIINYDYQVMMSTHDSIQANFFHRKLENEGVSTKIYQLVSRRDGVTAERLI